VLPEKGRVTTRSCLAAWLGQRSDGASCHRWPAADGALGVRQRACDVKLSSHVVQHRSRIGHGYGVSVCSDSVTMTTWWRRLGHGAVEEKAGGKLGLRSAQLQTWRKGRGVGGSDQGRDLWHDNDPGAAGTGGGGWNRRTSRGSRARLGWGGKKLCVGRLGRKSGLGPAKVLGHDLNRCELFQTVSNIIQTHSNLIWFKKDLSKLEKFEIKYNIDDFEERNNFLHRNFFRFEVDFE
jgi:hypothetical protein